MPSRSSDTVRQSRHRPLWVEPRSDGERVARLARQCGNPVLFQPAKARLQLLQDEFLQGNIAPRGLPLEGLQVLVGPDVAAGIDERSPEPVALLQNDGSSAQLGGSEGGNQPGETTTDDDDAHRRL